MRPIEWLFLYNPRLESALQVRGVNGLAREPFWLNLAPIVTLFVFGQSVELSAFGFTWPFLDLYSERDSIFFGGCQNVLPENG